MQIRHFQLPGFMSNALALPPAGIFLLCSYKYRLPGGYPRRIFIGRAVYVCHCQWRAKIFGCR